MTDWSSNETWGQQQVGENWAQNSGGWGDQMSQSWGQSNWETPQENNQQTQQSFTQETSAAPIANTLQLLPSDSSHSALPQTQVAAPIPVPVQAVPTLSLAKTQIPQINTVQLNATLQESKFRIHTSGSQTKIPELAIQKSDSQADIHQDIAAPQTTKAAAVSADFWNDPVEVIQAAPQQTSQPVSVVPMASKQVLDDFFDFGSVQKAATVQQQEKAPETVPTSSFPVKEVKAETKVEIKPKAVVQAQHERTQSDFSTVSSRTEGKSISSTSKTLSRADQKKLEKATKENQKKKEEMEKTIVKQAAPSKQQKPVDTKPAALPAKQPVQRPAEQPVAPAPASQSIAATPQVVASRQFESSHIEQIVRENERLKAEIACFGFQPGQPHEHESLIQLQERFEQWASENDEQQQLRVQNKVLTDKVQQLEALSYENSQNSVLYYQQQAIQLEKELIEKDEEKMRAIEQNNVALRKKNQQIQTLMEEVARLRLELGKK